MESYVTQYLADHLGLTEQAAQVAAQALIVVVPWLAGLLTPWLKRRTARGLCRVGAAFMTQPSPPRAATRRREEVAERDRQAKGAALAARLATTGGAS